MFFEDFKGFNCVSLPLLYSQKPRGYFSWELEESQNQDQRAIGIDTEKSRRRMTDVSIVGRENLLDEMSIGMYNSYATNHDLMSKKINGLKHEYMKTFDKVEHVNNGESNPLSLESIVKNIDVTAHYQNHFSGGYSVDVKMLRRSQVESFINKQIKFVAPGNSTLNVGDKIKLEFTKQNMTDIGSSPLDKYRTGYYLISSIKHSIIKGKGYTVTIEASADCLPNPYPDVSTFEAPAHQ